MSNQPNPKRDAQIINRALAGDCHNDIAIDMAVSKGRISQILTRNGLCGRIKEPGLPCVQWYVRWGKGGVYLCVGAGITSHGLTVEDATRGWRAELERTRRIIVVPATPTPARTHTVPVPLRLPAGMLQLLQRAAQAQPRLLNMGSKVPEGGVL